MAQVIFFPLFSVSLLSSSPYVVCFFVFLYISFFFLKFYGDGDDEDVVVIMLLKT